MIPDLVLAKLSAAAYQPNAYAAISALGLIPVWQVADPDCGAVVARSADGETVVAFRGTDLDLDHWHEAWDDGTAWPMGGPHGERIAGGFFRPLARVWPLLAPLAGKDILTVTGHSLGGARAALVPLLTPTARVVTFASPAPFYAPWSGAQTRYVYDRDPIPDVPIGGMHAGPLTWLRDGKPPAVVDHRDGVFDLDINDHAIARYVAALEAIETVSAAA